MSKAKTKKSLPGDVLAAFKAIDDLNPDATFLSESALSNISSYIDTGCMALNAIISGSMHKGIPSGRITGFAGPSMAGKTLIMNKIMANAQKKGYIPVIWDSEVAVDKKSAENVGMDTSKVKYYPVETVEDCRNQMSMFLDNVIKARESNPDLKFIAAIDSLGNLASAKEIKDAASGKDAADVGQRAKCLCPNTLVKTKEGIKKIKDVSEGEEVLTHLGRYRKIKNKWEVSHESYMIIKTKTGKEIKLSKEHRLLVKRDNQLTYLQAQEIKQTDKLVSLAL